MSTNPTSVSLRRFGDFEIRPGLGPVPDFFEAGCACSSPLICLQSLFFANFTHP